MSDDPEDRLLSELADLARQRDGLDERWDRLAAGTLAAEEEAELRALAETSPEAREAWEAFRPLGPEFQARVVDKIAAGQRAWWVFPFSPAVWFRGLVTAAAAAAVLLLVVPPDAPLPDYQIASVKGGSSETRGEQPRDFAPGDRIQAVLRPETASRTRVEAQLFLLRDGELRPLEAQSETAGGSVKMNGKLDRDLQPGTWTLWAVVGRPGELPDPAELQSLAARSQARGEDWRAVRTEIRIRPRAP